MFKKLINRMNNKGIVFISAVIFTVIIMVMAAIWMMISQTEVNFAKRNVLQTKGLYHAESGIEEAIHNLSSYIADNFADPPDPPAAGSIVGTLNMPDGFTVSYASSKSGAERQLTDPETGTTTYIQDYLIASTATSPGGSEVILKQITAENRNYVFQYAVFYEDDLEMFPGQNMDLGGRIHCNKDIFTAADGAATILTADTNYFRSAGQIFGYRKNNGQYLAGTVNIKVKDAASFEPMRYPSSPTLDCTQATWEEESQTRWNGTVKSSVHNVGVVAHPLVGSVQPNGFYAQNAEIVVMCDGSTNNILVQKRGPGGFTTLYENINFPAGTFSLTTGSGPSLPPYFRNHREASYVYMLNIDMKKLGGYDGTEAPGAPPHFTNIIPQNGLMYATINNIPINMQGGIRLYNGSIIYCKQKSVWGVTLDVGLTFVTNMPLYIKGDYNKDNAAAGFIKKPCAVICDAMNILSNNWNDANCLGGQAARVATQTEINSAFVSGITVTSNGQYNGGLENYPRLHENWSNVWLNIKGAFAQLWLSQIATGNWIYGTSGSIFYYNAPRRNWHYDLDFNNVNKLPPFTPFVLDVERKIWWK